MELTVLFFLTSGLFLGWSLGANDAANVFGTAVGTRMVRFTTAAVVCSGFLLLGAVVSGSGAAHTLGKLGAVNALGGSFTAALAAALTVYGMTRLCLPVSTSQAIVGAIIGWNLFSGSVTDSGALTKILLTWVACPLLAALIAIPLFKLTEFVLRRAKFHLLRQDAYTRVALILAGAFGSYSLGANNIANVMGVFVESSPFTDVNIAGLFTFSSVQQLFMLGALAIGVGVFTYSKRVMLTVGDGLMPMSPVAAWVVVVSHSIVLFLFASTGLEQLLANAGLPTIPLVPVSSSQAVVGAVVGIGLLKGGRQIKWRVLGNIGLGWMTTPVISSVLCFILLFFLQNVFNQQVYREVHFSLSPQVLLQLKEAKIDSDIFAEMQGKVYPSGVVFRDVLREYAQLSVAEEEKILSLAEISTTRIDRDKLHEVKTLLSEEQFMALAALVNEQFNYKWTLAKVLARSSDEWCLKDTTVINRGHNKQIKKKLKIVYRTFSVDARS